MGEWDIYCAICGGPLRAVRFASRQASPPSSSPKSTYANRDFDDNAYDPSVVREKETKWLGDIMVLAFYYDAPRLKRTYLTQGDEYLGYQEVEAQEGNLPRRDDALRWYDHPCDSRTFSCYRNGATHGIEQDPAYPFHRQCFKLLRRCWDGHPLRDGLHHSHPESELLESSEAIDEASDLETDGEDFMSEPDEDSRPEKHLADTDVLYEVMRELDEGTHLKVDYGDIWTTLSHHQIWESRAGEEVLVAHPGMVGGLLDRIRTLSNGKSTLVGLAAHDLTVRVKRDPFEDLPVELLAEISWHLSDMDDIVNLGKASWYVTLFLRGASNMFWAEALRVHTRWFSELQACLKMYPNVFEVIDMKALYLWVNSGTRSTRNLPRGHGLIRVANRRRIWKVCEDLVGRCKRKIKDRELEQVEEELTTFGEFLREKSCCNYMSIGSHDEQTKMHGGVRHRWWIREWEETYEKQQFVEVFFHPSSGFLAGISVSSQESEEKPSITERVRRTMGYRLGDPETGVIPIGDWVCGIILHIATARNPLRSDSRCGRSPKPNFLISPKGLTILCQRGTQLHFGETSQGHPQKVLVPRPNHNSAQIVGVMGQLTVRPPDEENLVVFSRIGLLKVDNSYLSDRQVVTETWVNSVWDDDYSRDNLLWKRDYADVLGEPIWNHPAIKFEAYDDECFHSSHDLGIVRTADKPTRQDLIPQEAFIWAKDRQDAKQLCRVSIYTKVVDVYTTDIPKENVTNVYGIIGFEAVYLSGERRTAGKTFDGPWVKQVKRRPGHGRDVVFWSASGEQPQFFRSDLDIDGEGGEFINSITCMSPGDRKDCFLAVLELGTNKGRVGGCILAEEVNTEDSFVPEGKQFLHGMLLTFIDQLWAIAAIASPAWPTW